MRKERILLLLGVWVTILPYLGFPISWKDTLVTLTGLGLIGFAYFLYNQIKKIEKKNEKENKINEKTFDNFVENNNFTDNNNI